MNYLQYKKLEQQTIEKGNVDAILYFQEVANPIMSSRIKSYKYTHKDLTKDESKQLLSMNHLNDNDVLIGGEVHKVICDIETKKHILKKTHELDLFMILDQISFIKSN